MNCECPVCKYLLENPELPGKGARKKRFTRWVRQGAKCYYCEAEIPVWDNGVLEHIVPKSKGGKDTVLACVSCDKMKQNYHAAEDYDAAIARLEAIKKKVEAYLIEL